MSTAARFSLVQPDAMFAVLMRLRYLAIENFRSFGKARFDLSRPDGEGTQDVVLLVGPSGTGKTALLDAVAGFFGGLAGELSFPNNPDPRGIDIYQAPNLTSYDVRQGADQATIQVGWTDTIAAQTQVLTLDCEAVLQSHGQRAELLRRAETFGWNEELVFEAKGDPSKLMPWRESVYQPNQRSGLILAFNEHRLLPWAPVAGPNSKKVARHRCLGSLAALDWDYSDFSEFTDLVEEVVPRAEQSMQWVVNVEYASLRAGKRQESFPLWELLIDALNRILAPCQFDRIDDENNILFRTATGTLRVESLSAGFKSLFLIVTDLALRLSLAAGSEEDPFAQEAVCLIDEIDAHLDPSLQERVLPDLRAIFPGVQFIVTTHSPVVASTVQRDQIFVLGEE